VGKFTKNNGEKVRGDTRVKSIKSDSDDQKRSLSSVFQEKLNGVTSQNWRLKKVARFSGKNGGVMPSVAARVSPTLVTPMSKPRLKNSV